MKIAVKQLRLIIREEAERLREGEIPKYTCPKCQKPATRNGHGAYTAYSCSDQVSCGWEGNKPIEETLKRSKSRLHEDTPSTTHTAPRGQRGNPANIRGRKMDAFMDWSYLSGAVDQAVMKARHGMMAGIKERDRNKVADAMRSLAKAAEEGLRVLKTGDSKQDAIDVPELDIDMNGF